MSRKKRRRSVKRNWHHTRGKSRGGKDRKCKNRKKCTDTNPCYEHCYSENELRLDMENLHVPLHTLFYNLRLKEIIFLLIFSWDTVCPHLEKLESNTVMRDEYKKRFKVWNEFFGEENSENREYCIEFIIKKFVRTREDKDHIKNVLIFAQNNNFLEKEHIQRYLKLMGIGQ